MNPNVVVVAVLFTLFTGFQAPAAAALYKCTSETGAVLLTDSSCPAGYTTDLVVPDTPSEPSRVQPPPAAAAAPAPTVAAPAPSSEENGESAAAKAARLEAELEKARVRSESEQERLRAIESKLDAVLDKSPTYYGGLGVAPIVVVPQHLPVCKKGQSTHCRPSQPDLTPRVVPRKGPSCGIVGCTPGITRRLNSGDPGGANPR